MGLLRCTLTTSLFLSPFVSAAAGIYGKDSAVLQLDGKDYDRLIARSNYTSMVEFYAPWCGHCKNLKPAYEKAAEALKGYANVAAINCDEETNKPFCGQMGVKGFPTLKIIKPAKVPGKRAVAEDYQGPRTARDINDAILDKIPNHVKKLTDKTLPEWLTTTNESAKGILFSDKVPVGPLMRTLAIDFLGSISFAQVRNNEKAAVETFGITKYPTILLLPGGSKDAIKYDGDVKKAPLVEFFSQVAPPNPSVPAADAPKSKPKAAKSGKSKASSASASCPVGSGSSKPAAAGEDTPKKPAAAKEDTPKKPAAEQPAAAQPDASKPPPPSITVISKPETLQRACLTTTSGTCILAFLPETLDLAKLQDTLADYPALMHMAAIVEKHKRSKAHMFPFYGVPASNTLGDSLLKSLSLGIEKESKKIHVVAFNAKKQWYVLCSDEKETKLETLEIWVDDLRFGEGDKRTLPSSIEVTPGEKKEKPKKEPEPVKEEVKDDADDHDEL